MVHPNSKKIQKPTKFSDLVNQRSKKISEIVDSRNNLIKEFKGRGNKNVVVDKRFLKKKNMVQKFAGTIEKRQKKKLAFFNVDSDEEQKIEFTHKGVNLDQIDDFKDFDDNRSVSDDNIDAEVVHNLHFGGFDEDGDGDKNEEGFEQRRKSKNEIYAELIHKSKKLKFLRQQQQEENDEKIQELDDDFEEIFDLLAKNPEQYKEEKKVKAKNDLYTNLQNQLSFDRRIKPEAANTVDPKLAKKKKKNVVEEEENNDSELGIEEEIGANTKFQRKMQTERRDEKKSKRFLDFMDDIKNLKKKGQAEEDSMDELEIEESEEDEEGDEFGDEDEDEFGDDDEEDFDDDDDDGL